MLVLFKFPDSTMNTIKSIINIQCSCWRGEGRQTLSAWTDTSVHFFHRATMFRTEVTWSEFCIVYLQGVVISQSHLNVWGSGWDVVVHNLDGGKGYPYYFLDPARNPRCNKSRLVTSWLTHSIKSNSTLVTWYDITLSDCNYLPCQL